MEAEPELAVASDVDVEALPLKRHRQVRRPLQLDEDTPSPIVCGTPAGTSTASPTATGILFIAASTAEVY